MPVLKVIIPSQFVAWLELEAERQVSNASELVRGFIREKYLASTTVVDRARTPKIAGPVRPVGRPPKRKPPKQGPPPPGVTVSMEPGVEHTIMWQRGGPEVWDAYDENFYRWLDENYPYDPETETRPNPVEVTEADIERFWAS